MWKEFIIFYFFFFLIMSQSEALKDRPRRKRNSDPISSTFNLLGGFGGFGGGFPDFGNMVSQISNMGSQITNMGSQIMSTVGNAMQPVQAMSLMKNMMNGVGGTTVVTFPHNDEWLLVRNGAKYKCSSGPPTHSMPPECPGFANTLDYSSDEDYCFGATSTSKNNGHICMSNGGMSVQSINGQVSCSSTSGQRVVSLSESEYRNLCRGKILSEAIYKYYSNGGIGSVQIPNSNPHVRCRYSQPGLCVFKGSDAIGSGSNVNMQSQTSNSQMVMF